MESCHPDFQGFTIGHPSSDSTMSIESWETAIRWIRTCQTQHKRCSLRETDVRWYPSRLLDLGPIGEDIPTIKVVETETVDMQSSPYITLSHCWGTSTIQALTRSSYDEYRNGVFISALPKTFQDAIVVARRLGIRFLWIDSLCIIQDDIGLADWLKEAPQMDKVYTNAQYNISAAGSNDSSQGLFFSRSAENLQVKKLALCLDPSKWSQENPPLTRYIITDFFFWENELAQAPLHRRGWVVQERLLAQGVIHFGRDQLFWECQETDACEAYPSGLPSILNIGANTKFKGLDPKIDGKKLREQGPHDSESAFFAYEIWSRIVKAYSKCLLTKPEDKLIAISGIAKKLSPIIGVNM